MIYISDDKENASESRRNQKPVLSNAKSRVKNSKEKAPIKSSDSNSCDIVLLKWINHKIACPVHDSGETICDSGMVIESTESSTHRKALALFQKHFRPIANTIITEVDEGKLIVREDRDVLVDLGLRETLFEILLSYELPWLRIGCEVIFGGVISPPGEKAISRDIVSPESRARWQTALKAFICDRLLDDPETRAQFNHSKLLSAATQRKLKSDLLRHFASKFLSLVLFLDLARLHSLLPSPLLFRKGSQLKSTKDALSLFCRNFLRAEGDLIRHLSSIGCEVAFEQNFVHEYDFSVRDIDKDMRDGVRLCRLVEMLHRSVDLCGRLRVPAISRLQKVHNVGIAIAQLKMHLNAIPLEAKDIVDGGRKIVDLMWLLAIHSELYSMISSKKVLLEAMQIRSNSSWRRTIYPAEIASQLPIKVPYHHPQTGDIINPVIGFSSLRTAETTEDTELSAALVEWCDSISAQYGVSVVNLGKDLADGKVLCLLMHYYHPSVLPATLISETLNDLSDCLRSNSSVNNAIRGERRNFELFRKACSALSDIPQLLPTKIDSHNVPDERAMLLFLGILFGRLVETSKQTLACVRIQRTIRHFLLGASAKYPTPYKGSAPKKTNRLQKHPKCQVKRDMPDHVLALTQKQKSSYAILSFLRQCMRRKKELRQELEITRQRKTNSFLEMQAEIIRYLPYQGTNERFEDFIVKLQSFTRMRNERSRYRVIREKVVLLQRLIRRVFAARRVARMRKLRSLAFQAIGRFILYHHLRRKVAKARSKQNYLNGIKRFQAIIRGAIIRKTNSERLRSILTRIAGVTIDAPKSLRLGSRTADALIALEKGYKDSIELQKLCETLELSTRLSRVCCEQLACGAASTLLFRLIRSCNRSAEHQEVLR